MKKLTKLGMTTLLLLGLLTVMAVAAPVASANPCEDQTVVVTQANVPIQTGNLLSAQFANPNQEFAQICQQANATAVNTGAGGSATANATNNATINQ